MRLLLALLLIICSIPTFAQADTTWLSNNWKPASPSNAVYISITQKEDTLFHKRIFFANTQQLRMDGRFAADSAPKRVGVFKWYAQQGWLTDSMEYRNGLPWRTRHFYQNGRTKTYLAYNIFGKATDVNSWYPDGRQKDCDTFYTDLKSGDCGRDTALMKGIIKKEEAGWHLCFYYESTGNIFMDGWFSERLCKTRIGINKWYHHTGALAESALYENGKLKERKEYFINGNIRSDFAKDETGKLLTDKRWDSTGQEKLVDTLYLKTWSVYCSKDLATFYELRQQVDSFWQRKTYRISTGNLEREEAARSRDGKGPPYYLKTFYETGELKESIVYEPLYADYKYDEKGVLRESEQQTNNRTRVTQVWDEKGKLVASDTSDARWPYANNDRVQFYKYINTELDKCNIDKKVRKELIGYLKVKFTIAAEGGVVDFKILQASANADLDKCVEQAIKVYGWKPHMVNGRPASYNMGIPFTIIDGKLM